MNHPEFSDGLASDGRPLMGVALSTCLETDARSRGRLPGAVPARLPRPALPPPSAEAVERTRRRIRAAEVFATLQHRAALLIQEGWKLRNKRIVLHEWVTRSHLLRGKTVAIANMQYNSHLNGQFAVATGEVLVHVKNNRAHLSYMLRFHVSERRVSGHQITFVSFTTEVPTDRFCCGGASRPAPRRQMAPLSRRPDAAALVSRRATLMRVVPMLAAAWQSPKAAQAAGRPKIMLGPPALRFNAEYEDKQHPLCERRIRVDKDDLQSTGKYIAHFEGTDVRLPQLKPTHPHEIQRVSQSFVLCQPSMAPHAGRWDPPASVRMCGSLATTRTSKSTR